ncbi:MAG: hypothetical protein GKS04_03845 [Candidatus Mycalebacterium zealandia]|nr:MAG: hypothetical protein GKS04_03845 [Candidatus Mycalebacterium zealandia]
MEKIDAAQDVMGKTGRVPKWILLFLGGIGAVGALAFALAAISDEQSSGAWRVLLINFLFWTAVAQGGVIFSCVLRITNARWGRSFLRISESFGSFLPVSMVLLIVIFLGAEHVLPYADHHYHTPKDVWLSMPFVVLRNLLGFTLMLFLTYRYVRGSLLLDIDPAKTDFARVKKLAPFLVGSYAVVFSLFSWDFMMSLDPHWFSTLFGPYYFIGGLISAVAMTIIVSATLSRYLNLKNYLSDYHFWDIGKMLNGFALLWAYLMFSQLLPIWYANMPEETGFVIKRIAEEPFRTFAWAVLTCCFIFPFVSFMPRTHKIVTPIAVFISTVFLCGLWMDKFLLITPSLTASLQTSAYEVLITLGFAGSFLCTVLFFLNRFPIIPFGDPFFDGPNSHHGGH